MAESLYNQLKQKEYKMPESAALIAEIEKHGRRLRSEWRSVPEPDEIGEGEYDLDVSELLIDEEVAGLREVSQTH